LAYHGIRLEDDRTVGCYGINKGSVIDVVFPLEELNVLARTSDGKKIPLKVGSGDSIRMLKQQIESKEGLGW
jgi:hypothetical protein